MIRHDLGVINNDNKQEVKDRCETNRNKVTKMNARIRKKVDKIKVKGKVDDVKEELVVRLFSTNCNSFGPHSEGKIEQLKVMSKIRKIDGLMIYSSDV